MAKHELITSWEFESLLPRHGTSKRFMEGSQPSSTSPYPTDGMRDDLYGEGLVPIRCLNEHVDPNSHVVKIFMQ